MQGSGSFVVAVRYRTCGLLEMGCLKRADGRGLWSADSQKGGDYGVRMVMYVSKDE